MIVATAIGLIIYKLRVSADAANRGNPVQQIPVRWPVLEHEVVQILVVRARQSVLLDAVAGGARIQSVAIDDVVADDGVVVSYRSWEAAGIVTVADQNAAVTVVKDGVVGDGHLIGRMP